MHTATRMNLKSVTLSERSQTRHYILRACIYVRYFTKSKTLLWEEEKKQNSGFLGPGERD